MTKRYEKIVQYFPNIEKDIYSWDSELEKFPIIIINEFRKPYIELKDKIQKCYDEFLSKKNSIQDSILIEKIREIYNDRDSILNKISVYVDENRNSEFIATRDIANWLKFNNLRRPLEEIYEIGKINWRTSLKIQESTFSKLIKTKFNQSFEKEKKNFRIVDVIPNKGIVFEFLNSYKVQVVANHFDFMLQNGGVIFNESIDEPLTDMKLLNSSKLYGERTLETIMFLLNKKSRKHGIYIKNIDMDIDYLLGDMYLYIKEPDYYIMPKLDNITERFKDLALGYGNKKDVDYIN